MQYRLTKGTVSKIRRDAEGVKALQAQGYKIDGECDEAGNVISTAVIFDEPELEPEPNQADAPKKRGPKPKGDKE